MPKYAKTLFWFAAIYTGAFAMTDKQRGALAATKFCLAILFGAIAIQAAWNQVAVSVALGILFASLFAITGYLTWSAKS